jgi:hypothetical protein
MDKPANRWSWLPDAMPTVARLLNDKRREVGAAHVAECWQRGVVRQEPGWFFAREGALAVGTPWPEIAHVAGWQCTRTQAMVILRSVESQHAA